MAFENVFGNVDFGLPVRAARADQATFLDAIGKGIANYQRGQQMDLRRRQLEGAQADLDQKAEQAAYQKAVQMGLSPQDAALYAYQAMQRPVFDPATEQFVGGAQPFTRLGGQLPMRGASAPQGATFSDMIPGMGAQRADAIATQADVAQVRPQFTGAPEDMFYNADAEQDLSGFPVMPTPMTNAPPVPQAQMPAIDTLGPIDAPQNVYQAPPELGRAGTRMEEETRQRMAEEYAKANYQQKLSIQKDMFDKYITDMGTIPVVQSMILKNRQTLDIPFADLTKGGQRFLTPEQADALDEVNQSRLELAAPLAKALGVNPTDKDFEASLNRIVNLNSTKAGREKQLYNLLERVAKKNKIPREQWYVPTRAELEELARKRGLKGFE